MARIDGLPRNESMTVNENKPPRPIEIVVTLGILLLAAGGLAVLLLASLVPPERLLRAAARGSTAGSAVDRSELLSYLARMRILGGVYFLASVGLLLARRPLARAVQAVALSMREEWTDMRRSLRAAFASGEGWWVVALTLLAAAVRLPDLNGPLRFDEAANAIYYVRRGLPYVVAAYSTTNHIFQNVLAWFGVTLFGFNPVALRLGSFTAGCLLVPLSYQAARALWDRSTALLAAAVVATWPYAIFLSDNARGYSLVLCCYATCLGLVPHIRRTNSPAGWTLFALVAALGLWSIPVMVYPLISLAVWMLAVAFWTTVAEVPPWRFLARGLAAGMFHVGVFVLLYTPGMIKSGLTAMVRNEMTSPMPVAAWLTSLPAYLGDVWAHVAVPFPVWIAPIVGALVLVEIFGWSGRRSLSPSPVPPVVLAIPLVLLLQRLQPFPRVQSFAFLLLILSSAAGATRLIGLAAGSATAARRLVWGLAVVVAGCLIVATVRGRVHDLEETGTCHDARQIAAFLRTLPPDDAFLLGALSKSIVDCYFVIDGPPRCRRYDPAGPPGDVVVWLVVPESRSIDEVFDIEGIPHDLLPQFHEYRDFPHRGRVLRYEGRPFPSADQRAGLPGA
jgi:hypothetical protein